MIVVNLNLGELEWENMEVHDLLISVNEGPDALIMIHDISPGEISHFVRLYLLRKENDEYVIDEQVEAFAFPCHEAAVEFADRLPRMPAIELLMLIRKEQLESEAHARANFLH